MALLYFEQPALRSSDSALLTVLCLGTAVSLFWWGLHTFSAELMGLPGERRRRYARRYRVHMPREAWTYALILAVLLGGAFLGHSNMLLLVFGLMAGPFVLNGFVTLATVKRLSVTRELPDHALAGELFPVRIRLSNEKRLLSSWMVVVEDAARTPHEACDPAVLFVRVPARSQREAVYRVRPQHRGVHVFGPARVTSRFPLGLVERSFELGGSDEVIVFPRIGRLTPRWHDTRRLGRRSSVVAPVRSGAYDDEFNRLREYRSGDNPRAIHWRTTARRNELMIREYQFQRDPDLILVVDLWTPDRPTNQDLANVELAVSFAATICSENGGAGAETGLQLIVCGREVSRSAGGPQSVRSLLEQLAVAQATRSSTVAEGIRLLEEPGGFERRRVLVTTRRRGELPPAVLAPQGANGNGAGSAHEWEVIVAEPTELSSYFEFEETLATVPS